VTKARPVTAVAAATVAHAPPGPVTKARRVTAVTAGAVITAVMARGMRGPTITAVTAVTARSCPPSKRHAVANAVWTAAECQQFAAGVGVASAIATAVSAKSSASFNPEEALDVSEDAILALFGQNRTAVLQMTGMPLQKEFEKDWKMRCAQAKEYEKQGRKVPSGFITPQWLFTFQYNRNLLFAAAPLKVHDIE
jgi:hypothetical protein